ncbi:glycosyltransferase [Catenovulum sediminis]|uniref:glycosyltransferase n=1 Tax=Catenovulum sediminis TaxID=1740262 RepID=UPI00117FC239|nr:glycosyltransferase [Catenovulum sediminis]
MDTYSVVLIIRNDSSLLECALRSFNFVEYPRHKFEVIVVDDGSDTPVASQFTCDFNFDFKLHYLPRTPFSSRSKARNFGACLAKHEMLLFIDGDHIVEPDILQTYSSYFQRNEDLSVVLGTRRMTKVARRIEIVDAIKKNGKLCKRYQRLYQRDVRLSLLEQINTKFFNLHGRWHLFWSCNFCIKKIAYFKVGGFDESFLGWGLEDVELGYKLYINGYRYELIDNYVWHLFPKDLPNGAEKYASWLKNMTIFHQKYQDIRILAQMEFENIFFFQAGTEKVRHAMDVNWIHKYINFEKKLAFIESNPNYFVERLQNISDVN